MGSKVGEKMKPRWEQQMVARVEGSGVGWAVRQAIGAVLGTTDDGKSGRKRR